MFRNCTVPAFTALLLVLPIAARAGGPPLLCLPVAGATAENADACAQRVAAALGKGVDRAGLRQNDGQWYLTFHFNRESVRLAEIDAALAGSPFSIRRDQLRLFGDVILEIKVPQNSADKLLSALASMKHVSVSESKRDGDTLLVTLKLPAPADDDRSPADFGLVSFGSETFRVEAASEPSVSVGDLPSYESLRKVVEKHDAKLEGLRWNCWGCRALGCVAGADTDRSATPAARAR